MNETQVEKFGIDGLSEVLVGTAFFLVVGLALLVGAWPREANPVPGILNEVTALLTCYLVAVVGFGIGWVRGFPRWAFPCAAFSFLFALYWTRMTTPGVNVLGHAFQRNEFWGWRAWIPLLAATGVGIAMTRTLAPLRQMARGIRQDWTRLSFAAYGIMPLAVTLLFDEVHGSNQFPFILTANAILVAGAFYYLRSRETLPRVLSLLLGTVATVLVAAVGNGIYWHGRQESWMRAPADGYREALAVVIMGGMLLGLMFLPALMRLRGFRRES